MENDVEVPGPPSPPANGRAPDHAYRTRYDPDGDERLTTTLACALATLEGVPPTRLDVCLEDALDTDALETIFRPGSDRNGVARLDFLIDGYAVTVRRTGAIAIRGAGGP